MARDEQIEHDSRKLSAKVEHHFPMMIFTLKWLNINQKYPNQLSTELFYEDWLPTVATSLDNANRSKQLFQITQLRGCWVGGGQHMRSQNTKKVGVFMLYALLFTDNASTCAAVLI